MLSYISVDVARGKMVVPYVVDIFS